MTEKWQWQGFSMQVSAKLRRAEGRYFHYCPGCDHMHPLPDSWTFDGNLEEPTFTPSFLQYYVGPQRKGNCHYILTKGVLNFCTDSWHALAGQAVPMPDIPEGYRDPT